MATNDITDYLTDDAFSRLPKSQQGIFLSPRRLLEGARTLTIAALKSPESAQDMYVMAERAGVITKKEILFVKLVEYSAMRLGGTLSVPALRISGYLAAAIFGESLNPREAGERFGEILRKATEYGITLMVR